jgi:glycosyltransferase involved in cell wall biosynthesis
VGVKAVSQLSHVALNADEISRLRKSPQAPNDTICFLSMGRLLYWKGFHLGIEAFSKAGIADAQYWIVGDGPDMPRLKRLVDRLGLSGCVRLLGALPRTQALGMLSRCHVLLHPSLHDSGGWVCAEAMAAGRPVICLNLGGPATIVTDECGVRVEAATPSATIAALAEAMMVLARDHKKRLAMGRAAVSRLTEVMTWEYKTDRITEFYSDAIRGSSKKK